MTTVDDIVAWWKGATHEERTEFLDAMIEQMGPDEFYLMLVDQAGGEEELLELFAEIERRSKLS